jgi:predicted dehydrogenase
MKEIIDAGTIGDVQAVWCRHFVANGGDWYFKDWHSQRQNTTGLLLQKGAHDIDVIHWLAGDYTQRVTAMGRLSVYDKCARRDSATPGIAKSNVDFWPPLTNQGFSPQIDIEDHTMLLMQLANGVQASYLQCHYSPISTRNYVFIGTKGCVENIGTTGSCRVIVYTSRRQEGDFEPDITYQLRPLSGTHGGADPAIVNEFLEFVRSGGPTKTNPVGARMAVAAGVQGTRSVRQNNGAYDIPPLDEKLAAYFTNGQKEQ